MARFALKLHPKQAILAQFWREMAGFSRFITCETGWRHKSGLRQAAECARVVDWPVNGSQVDALRSTVFFLLRARGCRANWSVAPRMERPCAGMSVTFFRDGRALLLTGLFGLDAAAVPMAGSAATAWSEYLPDCRAGAGVRSGRLTRMHFTMAEMEVPRLSAQMRAWR